MKHATHYRIGGLVLIKSGRKSKQPKETPPLRSYPHGNLSLHNQTIEVPSIDTKRE